MDNKIINPRIYKTISKDKKKKKDKIVKKKMKYIDLSNTETILINKTLKNNNYSSKNSKIDVNDDDMVDKKETITIKRSVFLENDAKTIEETQKYFTDKIEYLKNKNHKVNEEDLKNSRIKEAKTRLKNIEGRVKQDVNIKSEIVNDINKINNNHFIYDENSDEIILKNSEKNKYNKQDSKFKTLLKNTIKLSVAVISLFAIYLISANLDSIKQMDLLSVFSPEKQQNIIKDLEINIGIDNIDLKNNIIINELKHYSNNYLITIDTNYNINYELLNKIDKIDNKRYNLSIKESKYVTDIINKLKENKEKLDITKIDKTNENNIIVTLNKDNPYFVYSLKDININTSEDKLYECLINLTESKFKRKESIKNKNILKSINVLNYTDNNLKVEDFKKDYIQMFLTSTDEEINLIGRHDYNIAKYRSGESYFLLFNSKSKLISDINIRKAIVYSINRSDIVNSISHLFSEIIDIPYIYSDVLYKYDHIGAENILIENGYVKHAGIYRKNNQMLKLDLIVNKEDKQKLIIADNIKEMLEKNGIKLNILKLSTQEMNEKIKNKDYDMVLATVNLNESADIRFIYDYININENINNMIKKVEQSEVLDLPSNIKLFIETIYNEVACLGIVAKTTGVVYNKDIQGLQNSEYMNVFKDIENIVKIIK